MDRRGQTMFFLEAVFKDVGGRNAYNPPAPSCPKPDPLFLGPRLPGVDPKNSYQEVLVPVESEKLMVAPTYRGFDIEPQNNYMPDNPNKPHEPQMLGPKLPYIEENHKYGPVPPRNPPTDPMAGPIYPNIEFHNENNIVNERVHGQIVMAGPKYAGVDAKNAYQPAADRKQAVPPVVGPVLLKDGSNKYAPPLDRKEVEQADWHQRWHMVPTLVQSQHWWRSR